MSRRKGAVAERDTVRWFNQHGFPTMERRGSGFQAQDTTGVPGLTLEIKNQARLDLAGWVDQLVDEMDADANHIGAVVHKRRGRIDPGEWYATMPVSVLARLLIEAGYGQEATR